MDSVESTIKAWLRRLEADGLVNARWECFCALGDAPACGSFSPDCVPAGAENENCVLRVRHYKNNPIKSRKDA